MNPNFYSRYYTYIKPFTKSAVVKNYGPIIFNLFIITFFIFYAIKPTIETILVLQKKLELSTQTLNQVTQKAKNLSLAKQNLDNMDPRIKTKIQNLIPDTVSIGTITQTLEQSAKAHQASVSALQIQPLVIDQKADNILGSLTQISFSFNASGEYSNLVSLLQDLKNSARLISIDSMALSTPSQGSALVMTISGKAYYIK